MTEEVPLTVASRIWDSSADTDWNVIASLTEDEVTSLLTDNTFGRLAVNAPGGPLIFPVRYSYQAPYALIRTALVSELEAVSRQDVTLTVDDIGFDQQWAWSILARGWASDTSGSMDATSEEMQHQSITSWVKTDTDARFRVEVKAVSGWRFGTAPERRPNDLQTWNESLSGGVTTVGPPQEETST